MSGFGIGELAKRAGVAIDTVRYYERSGHGRAEQCPILAALSMEEPS